LVALTLHEENEAAPLEATMLQFSKATNAVNPDPLHAKAELDEEVLMNEQLSKLKLAEAEGDAVTVAPVDWNVTLENEMFPAPVIVWVPVKVTEVIGIPKLALTSLVEDPMIATAVPRALKVPLNV